MWVPRVQCRCDAWAIVEGAVAAGVAAAGVAAAGVVVAAAIAAHGHERETKAEVLITLRMARLWAR